MAALIKVLLADPEILLLDEPTKRNGPGTQQEVLENFYANLQIRGKRYLSYRMIWNFCAEYADRLGMMFDGKIEGIDEPSKFFAQKLFLYDRVCKDYERF